MFAECLKGDIEVESGNKNQRRVNQLIPRRVKGVHLRISSFFETHPYVGLSSSLTFYTEHKVPRGVQYGFYGVVCRGVAREGK